MTDPENNYEDVLQKRLEALHEVPDRNDQAAVVGRERYMAEMRNVVAGISPDMAVSETPFRRLNGWISNVFGLQYSKKERVPMLATLMAVILSISLMFGGAGATAFAANNSLPNDFLYPVKTAAEDARLELTSNPASEVDLLLTYADRRANEILTMGITGDAIPESVLTRLGGHYETIFLIVTGLDQPEAMETLQEVGQILGHQIQKLDRLKSQSTTEPSEVNASMNQLRYMWQYGRDLADLGLVDFDAFVEEFEAYRYKWQNHGPWWVDEEPGAEEGGYGPGPGPGEPACEECEPAQDGSGPGPGPGPNNQGEFTEPEGGYGPFGPNGTPACEDCDPSQGDDGNGPGPGPGPSNQGELTEPDEGYGPSGPYGTPACEENCDPSQGDDSSGPMGPQEPPDSGESNGSGLPNSTDSSKDNDNGEETKGK